MLETETVEQRHSQSGQFLKSPALERHVPGAGRSTAPQKIPPKGHSRQLRHIHVAANETSFLKHPAKF